MRAVSRACVDTNVEGNLLCRTLQALSAAVSDPFDVSPRSGTIEPFAKVPLLVEFAPTSGVPASGFHSTLSPAERMHRFVAAIDVGGADGGRPHVLPLNGTSLPKALSVAPGRLVFGDVACNGHRHLNCKLTNVATGAQVRYRARPSAAHFSLDPPVATIAPQATHFLAVIFHPKALGRFEGHVALELLGKGGCVIGEQTIAVVGTSNVVGAREARPRGPDALPEDFKLEERVAGEAELTRTLAGRPPKFVRPEVR